MVRQLVSDKKKKGEIRMNIDARPLNKGALMTKYPVPTAQEVRHQLKDSTVFLEIDMNHGFHQVPLSEETSRRCVFQTHKGIHRMKRLFFGPMSASGIFHHIVETQFRGLEDT